MVVVSCPDRRISNFSTKEGRRNAPLFYFLLAIIYKYGIKDNNDRI